MNKQNEKEVHTPDTNREDGTYSSSEKRDSNIYKIKVYCPNCDEFYCYEVADSVLDRNGTAIVTCHKCKLIDFVVKRTVQVVRIGQSPGTKVL